MLNKVVANRGHFIKDRKKEAVIGFIVTLIGFCLVWDAFDGRGKKLPWPASGMAPW